MNDTVKYQIERIGSSGRLTGMAWHRGLAQWVPIAREDAAIATKQGARAVAQEWEFGIGIDVMITEHIWPAPA